MSTTVMKTAFPNYLKETDQCIKLIFLFIFFINVISWINLTFWNEHASEKWKFSINVYLLLHYSEIKKNIFSKDSFLGLNPRKHLSRGAL